MYSLDEIWLKLTTSQIGFYTSRTFSKIPDAPGVYAWFLPLRLKTDPSDLLRLARQLAAYDCKSEGLASWRSEEAGFHWDPMAIELTRRVNPDLPSQISAKWQEISSGPPAVQRGFQIALMAATVFSRPLYVGLTTSLSRRHSDHTAARSGFNSRFSAYVASIGAALTVEQLLFACVPLNRLDDDSGYSQQQLDVLEHLLKVICQPVFDDR